jgi:site-specific recombinase XerD
MKRRIPAVLLPKEQKLILSQFLPPSGEEETKRGNALTRLRDLCMVRLMLNLGLRCSEVLKLRYRDLEADTGRLLIHGKGKKQRSVWLNEADVKLLQGYMSTQDTADPDAPVFTNLSGKPLSDRYVRLMVASVAAAAGITYKEVHPHTLRHTFATDMLRKTKNLRLVQKALGHESLTTTQIYTHVCDDELEEAMKGLRG